MKTSRSSYVLVLALLGAACGDSEPAAATSAGGGGAGGGAGGSGGSSCDTSWNPQIDPADFVAAVDNPLFPLVPGTVFTYEEGGVLTVTVEVTSMTKEILGVTTTVVHDVVTDAGEVVEDTFDWYAQDAGGAVWYFGEDTKELENGRVVSTAGSWEAGVDGARPGYIVPPTPEIGETYHQELYCGEAEDMAEVLALDATADVPFGTFTGCLQTRDFTPLEPAADENKYYCPGVGLVLAVNLNDMEREELVDVQAP
jgi:hypothetical protein